jgi:hypothetical protein
MWICHGSPVISQRLRRRQDSRVEIAAGLLIVAAIITARAVGSGGDGGVRMVANPALG